MGLGGPMTWWPDDMCRWLAVEGFFVIRYDNRDTGRSDRVQRTTGSAAPTWSRAFLRAPVTAPYSLHDMAGDGVARARRTSGLAPPTWSGSRWAA